MSDKNAILWFRNDLRLHDHEALVSALQKADRIIPVYCLDPRHFGQTSYGFPKTGAFRGNFLLECLQSLKARLREKGSDLMVVHGKPEEVLPALAKEHKISWVFAHKEVAEEETSVEQALETVLFKEGITLELSWGSTLYHPDDLPMPIQSLPDIFTKFRKLAEKESSIRQQFPTPFTIPTLPLEDWGAIPELSSLGLKKPILEPRAALKMTGGEVAGINRLQEYFWERNCLKSYKETRNGLLGEDYSSKFSPWLAFGCLSPRYIEFEIRKYEELRIANSSTYWLIFELIWRDYFRFVVKRYGNTVFQQGGIKQLPGKWSDNEQIFEAWKIGKTGLPFVDANMRELLFTGFMSNRGRQNVASFLVKDLQLDWRMGAEWFESQLIDYDVCSNWGNWNYVAGIGNDPRENRYFNVPSQSKRYDSSGEYIRTWLPEISTLPSEMIHEPWAIGKQELGKHQVILGHQYPFMIVDLRKKTSK